MFNEKQDGNIYNWTIDENRLFDKKDRITSVVSPIWRENIKATNWIFTVARWLKGIRWPGYGKTCQQAWEQVQDKANEAGSPPQVLICFNHLLFQMKKKQWFGANNSRFLDIEWLDKKDTVYWHRCHGPWARQVCQIDVFFLRLPRSQILRVQDLISSV